jgi:hypothetical protein
MWRSFGIFLEISREAARIDLATGKRLDHRIQSNHGLVFEIRQLFLNLEPVHQLP